MIGYRSAGSRFARLLFLSFIGTFVLGGYGLMALGVPETVALMIGAGLAWTVAILLWVKVRPNWR